MREGRPESRGRGDHRGHGEHHGPDQGNPSGDHHRDHRGDHRGNHRGGEHRGGEHRGKKELSEKHYRSAQTFRRGRAIAFLERLNVKRSTLQQQLSQPEFESIKQVISGELKAVDAIIQEFIQAFELREAAEENDPNNEGDDEPNDNSNAGH